MSIKSDKWIRRMAAEHGMIEPFEPGQVREAEGRKIISYGTSSYGYDIRCAPEFKVFTNIHSTVVDPKNFDEKSFVDFEGDSCIIPPNSFALARTVEYFRIPRNVLTICLGKSTYARCGIIVNVTPFEPEWEGYVTLEFSNTTPLPAKIYAGEGCAQVLFFESDKDDVCETRTRTAAASTRASTASPCRGPDPGRPRPRRCPAGAARRPTAWRGCRAPCRGAACRAFPAPAARARARSRRARAAPRRWPTGASIHRTPHCTRRCPPSATPRRAGRPVAPHGAGP
jgi:dCTP deaminase